jgi:hypothetical protein
MMRKRWLQTTQTIDADPKQLVIRAPLLPFFVSSRLRGEE